MISRAETSRYTPDMVEQACGVPPEVFARVCELVTDNSGPERTTAVVYSVGWTQHTVGAQYIRTAAVATYTAALICDTAVPAWHAGYREMPYVFAGSAASAAGDLGLLATAPGAADPARRLAVLGAGVELIAGPEVHDRAPAPARAPGRSALTRGDRGGMNWRLPLLRGMVILHLVPPPALSPS